MTEQRKERKRILQERRKTALGCTDKSVFRSGISRLSRENFHKKETMTGERKKFQAKEFHGLFLRHGMLLKKDIRR